MSKKHNEVNDTSLDPKAPPEAPAAVVAENPPAPEKHVSHRSHLPPSVGRIIHYWKRIPQNNGVQNLEPLPGIISGLNPPGSFQKADWAIAAWVFPNKPGAAPEAKHGVLYSETPAEGRWSYPVIK
jgi:hypothetical protein